MHPWALKNLQPGATICCQNAPVAIGHKDIITYRNSYILLRELCFVSYFTCFHNKYQRKAASLFPYLLISSGNSEYFENCPWFIWNCLMVHAKSPWEPGAILKCKLLLVPAGLFQGLGLGLKILSENTCSKHCNFKYNFHCNIMLWFIKSKAFDESKSGQLYFYSFQQNFSNFIY